MHMAEWNEAQDIEFLTPEPPPSLQDLQDTPDEHWLPARDVTIMTIVAFALIAFAAFAEFFR